MLMSVIVPCFNEEQVLPIYKKEMDAILLDLFHKHHLDMEYIFVNDGSKDQTLHILRTFANEDARVRYISFSRNFGKEAALYAGLQHAKGDYVVVMDADLQDPPSLLPEMYISIVNEGYDCVATRRITRNGEPPIRSWFAKKFYQIINRTADTEIVDGARDFRMMKRQMVDAILSLCEYNRFSKGIFSWVGFDTKWIAYENVSRAAGQTKWNFFSLMRYAMEGIVGYTTAPLEYAAFIGVILFIISIISILFIIVRKLLFGDPVSGWASTVTIMLFCAGVQLFCTGIIGEYLAKTYLEVKNRPIYIVKETEVTYKKQQKN